MSTRRLSSQSGRRFSKGCGTLFFLPFLLMGLGFACFLGWMFVQDLLVYQTYVEGTCEITAKRLLESSDDDGTTYAPHFEFQVSTQNGEIYRASGYQRSQMYSSGRAGKEAILARYSVEQSYPCWYNPANPQEAVLARGLSLGWAYLVVFIPLIFVAVGAGGLYSGLRTWGKSEEAEADRFIPAQALAEWLPDLDTKPGHYLDIRLPPQSSHRQSLLVATLIALFWNGIVSVFVLVGLTQDDFPVWAWYFLTPFILIGLFLIFNVGRQTLTWIFGGRTIVELSDEPLQFGQSADLFIRQSDSKPVQSTKVMLICQEWVRYRQGTDTNTEERVVYETVLFEQPSMVSQRGEWQQSLQFTIPRDAMHSFKTDNNAINWQIVVEVKLAGSPDFKLAFPLRVVPPDEY
jgi:hypothetical protein